MSKHFFDAETTRIKSQLKQFKKLKRNENITEENDLPAEFGDTLDGNEFQNENITEENHFPAELQDTLDGNEFQNKNITEENDFPAEFQDTLHGNGFHQNIPPNFHLTDEQVSVVILINQPFLQQTLSLL